MPELLPNHFRLLLSRIIIFLRRFARHATDPIQSQKEKRWHAARVQRTINHITQLLRLRMMTRMQVSRDSLCIFFFSWPPLGTSSPISQLIGRAVVLTILKAFVPPRYGAAKIIQQHFCIIQTNQLQYFRMSTQTFKDVKWPQKFFVRKEVNVVFLMESSKKKLLYIVWIHRMVK